MEVLDAFESVQLVKLPDSATNPWPDYYHIAIKISHRGTVRCHGKRDTELIDL